jgi:hypothetical protein
MYLITLKFSGHDPHPSARKDGNIPLPLYIFPYITIHNKTSDLRSLISINQTLTPHVKGH